MTAFLAAPALGQSGGVFLILFDFGPKAHVTQWDMDAQFTGTVVVRFETAYGTGTTVWTPGDSGQFTVAQATTGKGRRMAAFLASTGSAGATARVERGTASCTDTLSETFDQAATIDGRDGVKLALASTAPGGGGFHMTETRCGGPLAADIARVVPSVSIPRSQLLKGGFDIDLSGNSPLSVPGMTGTVESSVVVHVGKRKPRERSQRRSPGPPPPATREARATYAIESVSGAWTASFAGGGEVCTELDSCGAAETLALRPGGRSGGSLSMSVTAPATRPARDLRTAIGLERGGNRRGLAALGYGAWTSRAATLTAALTRDGHAVCGDQRHIRGGVLELTARNGVVHATLASDPTAVDRTICPGPSLASGRSLTPLASGSLPLTAFEKPRVVLHLKRGAGVETDGWSGHTRADLTIVLRRKRTTVRTQRF